MAYAAISKPSLYQNNIIYTGTAATLGVTGVGFQPDFTWIKNRVSAQNSNLVDAVRGVTKVLYSDSTAAEYTNVNSLTAFDSDGFTVGSSAEVNGSTNDMVSWSWKANGAGVLNEVGDIDSTVSVNTTSKFSIVKWTGNTTNSTVGHGLGVVPNFIIVKNLEDTGGWAWRVYNSSIGATKRMFLNTTDAAGTDSTAWNDTAPTSTVFTVGTSTGVNGSGDGMIAYVFADLAGYSKFGSYSGNSNADGTFVYTGFKPSFIIVKGSNESGQDWAMFDDKRDPINKITQRLQPSSSAIVSGGQDLDFLSNGFKPRVTGAFMNGGYDYIYMAFAAEPLVANVGNGIPATAR